MTSVTKRRLRHSNSASGRCRRLAFEPLERRELLATLAVHWNAAADAAAVSVPAVSAAGEASNATGTSEARYAAVADATKVEAVYGPLPLAVATAVAENEFRTQAVYAAGAVADQFLAQHKQLFGVQNVASELVPHRVTTDALGMTHLRYQQEYQGIPVFGAELLVHLGSDERVASANGRLVSEIQLDTTPQVSADEAVVLAQRYFAEQPRGSDSAESVVEVVPEAISTKLYVFNAGLLENRDKPVSHLVWEVHVQNDSPLVSEFYLVDAHTGELVDQWSGIAYAPSRLVVDYSRNWGGDVDYYDPTRGHTFGRSEGQPARGVNPITGLSEVDDVYDMLGLLYDFYQTKFHRYDDDNVRDIQVVWVNSDYFSMPSARYGYGTIAISQGLVDPETVAHEYAHGVQENISNLLLQHDAVALVESFSDVMSEMAGRYATGTADWASISLPYTVEVYGQSPWYYADPTKSRSNVAGITWSPDRYHSPFFVKSGPDNPRKGEHENGLVPTYAAYLVAMGGTFNGYEIAALGCDKMEQIWYRAYSQYFVSSETFNDAYHDLIQAARDLYGDADAAEVRKALQAVEMNLADPRLGIQEATVSAVTTSTPLVNSISIQFTQDMNISGMMAAPVGDGSISSAVSLVNRQTGPVVLQATEFVYDSLTRTLTWTGANPIPTGYYELRLRGDLLSDSNGIQLWGGTSGLGFVGSPPAAVQQSPTLDAQGGVFVHTFYAGGLDDGPSVTISQATDQADPAKNASVRYSVVFSEPVTGFGIDDVVLTGTAAGRQVTQVSGSGTTYEVTVAVTGNGTVLADIPAGAAEDGAGHSSLPSTRTNNIVACDIERPGVTVAPYLYQPEPTDKPIRFTVTFTKPVTGFGAEDVLLSGSAPGAQVTDVSGSGTTYQVTVTAAGNGTVIADIADGAAQDADGRLSTRSTSLDNSVVVDLTPLSVTINQASYQADPTQADTTGAEVRFTVEFSRSVGGFQWRTEKNWGCMNSPAAIQLSGTAPGMQVTSVLGGPTQYVCVGWVRRYEVTVRATGPGTIMANIPAAIVLDRELRSNEASTSTDNMVTIVNAVPPTVTISQAAGQTDPTNQTTIHFAVAFSKPVLDFDAGDVSTFGSTALATVAEVTTTDQTMFDVAVNVWGGVMGQAGGIVRIMIAAGAAHDADGAASLEPIIVDNTVSYDGTPPTATIKPATGQSDPTNQAPVNFAVTFSEPVSDFTDADVTLSGTAGPTTAVVTGDGSTYNVAVGGMTGRGTVEVQIAAGVAFDPAGNGNTASAALELLYTPWHNLVEPCDVDGNGSVEPLDVLLAITYINSHPGETQLPAPPAGQHPYYDVSDDGACTAIDVLLAITWINSHPAGAGEGESATAAVPSASSASSALVGLFIPSAPRDASGVSRPAPLAAEQLADARKAGGLVETRIAGQSEDAVDGSALVPRDHDEEDWPALDADLLGLDSLLTDIASQIARDWTAAA